MWLVIVPSAEKRKQGHKKAKDNLNFNWIFN